MNDRNQKQESSTDLKVRLLKHLEETGYPVELTVGNILSKRGWQVEHNRYYIDEDEQKGREVDIAAHQYLESKKYKLRVGLALICEVKCSQRHPWVVLSTTKGFLRGAGWGKLRYQIGKIDSKLISSEEIESMSTTSQLTRCGRSYCEGFKSANAKSAIFEALTTVVKASEHWVKKQEEAIKALEAKGTYKKDFRELLFVDPIVVLDGLLYEAYLDDKGHLGLNEIKYIPISFGYISKAYGGSYLVEIVTTKELPNLLLKKLEWINGIKETLINKLRKPSQ